VRRRLPAGDASQRLAFLRGLLQAIGDDADGDRFRAVVGNFVLGMTLEIGHTFQDEYDKTQLRLEQAGRLIAELEKNPTADEAALSRAMFHAGVTDRELRRLRAVERRWKETPEDTPPFEEFSLLKRNAAGGAADPDQRMVFGLAERYRSAFPFLDEFLAGYRRLANEIRAAARRLNDLLAASGG